MARQGTAGSRTASADPTGPPSSSEQTPRPQVRAHEVHPHVRRLPDGQKPSPQRVELARECGIELEHNETLVTGHLRGNKPHEGASAGAEGPEHVLPTSMGERMTDEDAIRQLLEHDVPPEQAPAFLRAPYRRIWEAHQRRKQLEREEAERLEQVLRRMERMDPYSYYNEEINRHPLKRLKHTLLG